MVLVILLYIGNTVFETYEEYLLQRRENHEKLKNAYLNSRSLNAMLQI